MAMNETVKYAITENQLYQDVNYYDRMVKLPDENPTIGILLCTEKNDTAVRQI